MNRRAVVRVTAALTVFNVLLGVGLWFAARAEFLRNGARASTVSPATVTHVAELIATTAFRSVITHDYAALNTIINQMGNWPDVIYVSVEDTQGQILAHTEARRVGQLWTDRVAADIRTTAKVPYEDVTVVMSDPSDTKGRTPIGRVRLGYVVKPSTAAAGPDPRTIPLWGILALVVIVSTPLGFVVSWLIARSERSAEAKRSRLQSALGERAVELGECAAEIEELRRERSRQRSLIDRLQGDLAKQQQTGQAALAAARQESDRLAGTLRDRMAELAKVQKDLETQIQTTETLEAHVHQIRADHEQVDRLDRAAPAPHAPVDDEEARVNARAVSYLAHVFRNSLTNVLGFSKLLLRGADGALSEGQSIDVQNIHAAGTRLLELVNLVSELARADLGTLGVDSEIIDTNALLKEIASATRPGEVGRVKVDDSSNLPPMEADRHHVMQIIRTVIQPGLSLGGGDGEAVLSGGATADTVRLEVGHPGRFIVDGDLPTFFAAFPSGERPVSTPADGGRLRLALARALAAVNRGALSVENRAETGVLFVLTLPRADTENSHARHPEQETAER